MPRDVGDAAFWTGEIARLRARAPRITLHVEGQFDFQALRKHIHARWGDRVYLPEPHYNRADTSRRAQIIGYAQDSEGVICVVDDDYERFIPECPRHPRAVYTDHNDLECTVIDAERGYGALERALLYVYDREGYADICEREGVLRLSDLLVRAASTVGRYRLVSRQLGLRVRFADLPLYIPGARDTWEGSILAEHAFQVDRAALECVLGAMNTAKREEVDEMIAEARTPPPPVDDLLHLCRGHDIEDFWLALLARHEPRRPLDLAHYLAVGFEEPSFQATDLSRRLARKIDAVLGTQAAR